MSARIVVPDISALERLVGEELGVSDWVEITQQRIDTFAEATGDHQWIHVDVERARRESPFGSTVAHGNLTVSLAPVLLAQILHVEKARILVNPGVEQMRLRAPVRVGSRVRMHARLTRFRALPGGAARVTLHIRFEVEGESRPAAFGNALIVFYP
jgi:acyl dehydratase